MLLIIIIIAKKLTSVKCGHFKMSKVSHLTMILPLQKLQDWYNFFVYLILAMIALQNAHNIDSYSFLENIDEHVVTISSGQLVHTICFVKSQSFFYLNNF